MERLFARDWDYVKHFPPYGADLLNKIRNLFLDFTVYIDSVYIDSVYTEPGVDKPNVSGLCHILDFIATHKI